MPFASSPGEVPPERVALADPTLPVDPEHAARLLGEALRRRHDEPPTDSRGDPGRGPSWPLSRLAEHVHARAAQTAEKPAATIRVTMPEGPYLGRPVEQLAVALVEMVAALPQAEETDGVETEVAITLGLSLEACFVEPSGGVVVDRPGPAPQAWGDRHVDLAAAAVGLNQRFGPAVVVPMIDAYGFDAVDARRLDTAQLLVALADVVGWPSSDDEAS